MQRRPSPPLIPYAQHFTPRAAAGQQSPALPHLTPLVEVNAFTTALRAMMTSPAPIAAAAIESRATPMLDDAQHDQPVTTNPITSPRYSPMNLDRSLRAPTVAPFQEERYVTPYESPTQLRADLHPVQSRVFSFPEGGQNPPLQYEFKHSQYSEAQHRFMLPVPPSPVLPLPLAAPSLLLARAVSTERVDVEELRARNENYITECGALKTHVRRLEKQVEKLIGVVNAQSQKLVDFHADVLTLSLVKGQNDALEVAQSNSDRLETVDDKLGNLASLTRSELFYLRASVEQSQKATSEAYEEILQLLRAQAQANRPDAKSPISRNSSIDLSSENNIAPTLDQGSNDTAGPTQKALPTPAHPTAPRKVTRQSLGLRVIIPNFVWPRNPPKKHQDVYASAGDDSIPHPDSSPSYSYHGFDIPSNEVVSADMTKEGSERGHTLTE